jgi:DNA polymerase I-like protein with 3'-5' exonuclease and polymerase domains
MNKDIADAAVLVFDVETTTHNKGHPFDPRKRLISYAFLEPHANDPNFSYYSDPDFSSGKARVLTRLDQLDTLAVGFNIKFDLHWYFNLRNVQARCKVWDCQLAEHILTGQQSPYLSLNAALESYALPTKLDAVKEYWDAGIDTADIPVAVLEEYNKWDVQMTYELYKTQRALMTPEQIVLLLTEGEDMKTLIAAERNGIKWDRDNAKILRENLQLGLDNIQSSLLGYLPSAFDSSPIVFNWDSGDQLSCLLYGGSITYDYSIPEYTVFKSGPNKGQSYIRNRWLQEVVEFPKRFKPIAGTEVKKTKDNPLATTRLYQVDDPTLQQLKTRKAEDKSLLHLLRERSERTKVAEMVDSIEKTISDKNWQDDYIHGQYNQNVAVTGRLSSSAPNMQNTPPEIDQLLVSRYND